MDAELSAALIMFDGRDGLDLDYERQRLRDLHAANKPSATAKVRIVDLTPGPQGPPVRVRIYEPRPSTGPAPALLWLHGGAFAYGFAELDDDLCVRLCADSGYLIASPDYRLSPEHPFPAAHDDAYETLRWMVGQATSLGIDPDLIAVGGSSAGGALAAGVCLRARDEQGPRIRQQILACPVIDDRLSSASMEQYPNAAIFTPKEADLMWRRYLGDRRNDPPPYAVPARATSLVGLPPTYVLTADEDPLRDEGIAFAVRLIADGNRVELHHVPETFHSFDSIVPTAGVSQRIYVDYLAALQRGRG